MSKIGTFVHLKIDAKNPIIVLQRVAFQLRKSGWCHTLFYFTEVIAMKRIKAACICQTLHFQLKEDMGHEYAVKMVKEEVSRYKASLERSRTKYRILKEETLNDGSILIEIKKQYNMSPVGDYLN